MPRLPLLDQMFFEKNRVGLTLTDIADLIGVDVRTICRWQSGTNKPIQAHIRMIRRTIDKMKKMPAADAYREFSDYQADLRIYRTLMPRISLEEKNALLKVADYERYRKCLRRMATEKGIPF